MNSDIIVVIEKWHFDQEASLEKGLCIHDEEGEEHSEIQCFEINPVSFTRKVKRRVMKEVSLHFNASKLKLRKLLVTHY